MLNIRKETNAPIMWRAYQIGLNKAGQLILAGAHNGKWTDVDFVAKCAAGGHDNGGHAMTSRAFQSKVFLPGELQATRRQDDNIIAHKRCKLHLETAACSCGIWGYKAPARVQRDNYLSTEFWTGRESYSASFVQILCSVRVYGTVLVGDWGYRASNGRIEAMFVPANTEIYAIRNAATMAPQFDGTTSISFFQNKPDTRYMTGVAQRLDPEVVWRKLAHTYGDAQIIHVADGVQLIQQLDIDCPDPVVKPIEREVPYIGE